MAIASFPGLSYFYLLFAFAIIHGTNKKQGRPGSIYHMCGREVDVGGEGPTFKYVFKLKASFLPFKMSSFDHAKVWSPNLW